MLKIVQENDALKASKGGLADRDDRYILRFCLINNDHISEHLLYAGQFATTWDEMFRCIADVLYTEIGHKIYDTEYELDKLFSGINELIQTKEGPNLEKFKSKDSVEILQNYFIKIQESDLSTITRHLIDLGLIEYKDNSYFLTEKGKSRYLQMVALKKK